jgi:hypothetical protein
MLTIGLLAIQNGRQVRVMPGTAANYSQGRSKSTLDFAGKKAIRDPRHGRPE